MDTPLLIKIILMIAFFLEVVIFGKFISGLKCFNEGNIMSIAMTFSGTLFLSIAMLDIIPEAIEGFDIYFQQVKTTLSSTSSLHRNSYLPLTMIIACLTFMIIMYIDKILIGHSHDHEYEVSFIKQPRKSQRQIEAVQMKTNIQHNINQHQLFNDQNEQKAEEIGRNNQNQDFQQAQRLALSLPEHKNQKNYRPFILQAGMSIHAFFQCLAVGLQKTPIGILSLASAILVHKWAQGLTLGLIYRKEGYSNRISTIMVVFQGFVNVLGLVTGASLMGQGHFVIAFFMSISAGTFLYISLAEVLFQQIQSMNKRKMITMLTAICFISMLVWLQKYSQHISSDHQQSQGKNK